MKSCAHQLRKSGLAAVHGPVLLVDDHGWVAHASGVAATRRIAAPRGERALTVPGLGVCVPEQLSQGWLIRPIASSTTILMTLHLGSPPTVEVTSVDTPWRSAVTGRHAEILLLLHDRGRAGMSVPELSHALFGDDDHAVTVRAEVSRLRRALGSVLESKPYRLADRVELSLDLGTAERLAECDLVRHTTSPGVRRLAGAV